MKNRSLALPLLSILAFLISISSVFAQEGPTPPSPPLKDLIERLRWSTAAHADLVSIAFHRERADCRQKMREGSEWVDSLPNQLPSRSYMHAMRARQGQSVEEARRLMADFVQRHYETALGLKKRSTRRALATPASAKDDSPFTADGLLITDRIDYLQHCYERGVALHPVMDSTSPPHADFAIWSITDIEGMLAHGDMPEPREDDRALAGSELLTKKTVSLMRSLDTLYMELEQVDFLFEARN